MFSDPLAVTYNGSGKSLARGFGKVPMPARRLDQSSYNTNDGEFRLSVIRYSAANDMDRVEVILGRHVYDSDSNVFNGAGDVSNSVGLIIQTNRSLYNTATDIPLLRTALLSLVDSTMQNRLISGEL